MLTIQLDSPVPLADQLVTGIRCAIALREVRAGDPLPTVRQLAGDLGINMNTVSRAYRVLEASGLVTTVRGRGSVVAAEQERPTADPAATRDALALALRSVLADLRLAGLQRGDASALIEQELDALWQEND
jgi:DNA-binding transcriptional regulator YhcF (GntR family)